MSCKYFLLHLVFCVAHVLCLFTPVLVLPQGKIRGFHAPLTNQYKYLGIPYATAEKRFHPPQAPRKWEGVLDAINPIATCPQAISYLILGNEDCLYLDVHAPAKNASALPVMVFLHGGAYYHGAKYHYDPAFLVSHDVIVVIINYRLGVLGFLCVNGVANLGIKDQIAALKWVKDNIIYFGGDADNVTLFGQSAGASAVGMHLVIDASKQLFHKAILQSGNPLAPWAFTVDGVESSTDDARALGARNHQELEIYETFYNASLFDLLVATKDTSINTKYFKYSPCVDGEVFKDTAYNTLASGDYNRVPLLVGATDNEGLLFYGLHSDESLKHFNDNFADKLPSVFNDCATNVKAQISTNLRDYYFKNNTIDRKIYRNISRYYGDWIAYSTHERFLNLLTSHSESVYSYIFSYDGDRNLGKRWFTPQARVAGASHTDDLFYVFKPLGISMILTNRDKLIVDRMAAMWTQFARTGNPTPFKTALLPITWEKYNDNKSILNIDTTMKLIRLPNELRGDYFLSLLCEYGKSGYVPCHARTHARSTDNITIQY